MNISFSVNIQNKYLAFREQTSTSDLISLYIYTALYKWVKIIWFPYVQPLINRLVPHFLRTRRHCSEHLCPACVKSEGVLLLIHYKRLTIVNSFNL